MSRVLVHMFSEFDELGIECQDDEPVIWITGDTARVSLSLSAADRAKLRKALDDADASEHFINHGVPLWTS